MEGNRNWSQNLEELDEWLRKAHENSLGLGLIGLIGEVEVHIG